MEHSALLKKPCFHYPAPYCRQVDMWAKPLSEFNTKYSGGVDSFSFFHSCRPLHRDHEKFGKSTTRFSQTFTKAVLVLRINQHFWGEFCRSVLFNDVTFIVTILLTVDQL